MDGSIFKSYSFNIGFGAAIGAWSSFMLQNLQVWRSPNGGIIACLFAERVAANPFHINLGYIVAVNAAVSDDYTLVGKIVPTVCSFNVLLISCIGLGVLIAAGYTYTLQRKESETRPS